MALDFAATGQHVNFGVGPLGAQNTALTVLAWVKFDALAAGDRIACCGGPGGGATDKWFFNLRGSNDFAFAWLGSTNLNYVTVADVLLGRTGEWLCMAAAVDVTAGAGNRVVLMLGDLATPVAVQALATATDGAGFDTATREFWAGGYGGASGATIDGQVARVLTVSGVQLSVEEVRRLQFAAAPNRSDLTLWADLGLVVNGTTQLDRTGGGNNGSVTGATVAPHAPLRIFALQPQSVEVLVPGVDNDQLARMAFAASGGGLLPWMW